VRVVSASVKVGGFFGKGDSKVARVVVFGGWRRAECWTFWVILLGIEMSNCL